MELVFDMMFVLVIGVCELTALIRVFSLLLGVPGKLFLITSAALRTFLVLFGAKFKLLTNFFFFLCDALFFLLRNYCISVKLAMALVSFPIFVL